MALRTTTPLSRKHFLRRAALLGAAVAGGAACGSGPRSADASTEPDGCVSDRMAGLGRHHLAEHPLAPQGWVALSGAVMGATTTPSDPAARTARQRVQLLWEVLDQGFPLGLAGWMAGAAGEWDLAGLVDEHMAPEARSSLERATGLYGERMPLDLGRRAAEWLDRDDLAPARLLGWGGLLLAANVEPSITGRYVSLLRDGREDLAPVLPADAAQALDGFLDGVGGPLPEDDGELLLRVGDAYATTMASAYRGSSGYASVRAADATGRVALRWLTSTWRITADGMSSSEERQ